MNVTATSTVLPPTVEIHVGLDHIRDGQPCEPRHCPIALAILAKLAESNIAPISISVGGQYCYIDILTEDGHTHVYNYLLTPEASRFIRAFDNRAEPEPFSFVMQLQYSYEQDPDD